MKPEDSTSSQGKGTPVAQVEVPLHQPPAEVSVAVTPVATPNIPVVAPSASAPVQPEPVAQAAVEPAPAVAAPAPAAESVIQPEPVAAQPAAQPEPPAAPPAEGDSLELPEEPAAPDASAAAVGSFGVAAATAPAGEAAAVSDAPAEELEDLESPPSADPDNAVADAAPRRGGFSPFRYNRLAFTITGAALAIILLIGIGSIFLASRSNNKGQQADAQPAANYSVGSIPLGSVKTSDQLQLSEVSQLAVNGQLKVNDTLVVTPGTAPAHPVAGQIYYDQATNEPYYYNGTQFVSLAPQHVTSIGGASGVIGLGQGLSVSGGQLSLSANVLQQIASAGAAGGPRVTSLQGQTGDVTLSAGPGININGTVISNNGVVSLASGSPNLTVTSDGQGHYTVSEASGSGSVTSIAGTANQINVSANTGSVVLSLPQDIGMTSTPTFNGITLTGISGNGVLYTNGGGALQSTGSANNSVLVTNGSGLPSLSQTLPAQVQANITQTGTLTGGSITAGFGVISTVNNITTTALLQSGSLEVTGGNFTVDTAGNVVASGDVSIQGPNGITIGVPGTTAGSIVIANGSNGHSTILQALASATQDQTITIPVSTAANDQVCLLTLGNCVGAGGGVTSVGTQNYIPKFTNAAGNQVGNSLLYDNGVGIGVGTATPGAGYLLDVNGNLNTAGGATVGNGLTITAGGATITGDVTQTGSGAFSTGSGAVSLNGDTTVGGAHTLTVGSGAVSFGGTLGVTGATTLNGGLTVAQGATITGDTNINATGTANTFIGNPTGSFGLSSSGLNVSTSGAVSGVTGYDQVSGDFTQHGSGAFSTGSGAVSLNGATTISSDLTVQGSGGISVGVSSATTGAIVFYNSSGSHTITLEGPAADPTGNYSLTLPTLSGNDVICTVNSGNCAGSGGGITGGGTGGTIPLFSGSGSSHIIADSILTQSGTTVTVGGTLTATALQGDGSGVTNVDAVTLQGHDSSYFTNASNISSGTLADARLSTNVALLNGTNNFTGTLQHNGHDVCDTSNNCDYAPSSGSANYIWNGTVAQTANFDITGTGTLGTLAVVGDATVGGNLTVTGTSTLTGAVTGGTYNGQTISSAASLTGSLSVASDTTIGGLLTVTGQLSANGGLTTNNAAITTGSGTINGATITGGSLDSSSVNGLGLTSTAITGTGALSLSAGGTNQDLSLQGSGTGGVIIQTPTFYNANGATYSFDASDASSITATICTSVGNCTTAGAAGGDLTGTYPNPTIAKLQGTPFLLSTLASGQVLQYDGTNWINNLITNSNLQAGAFANITGVGALTSGSIANGFGNIDIGSNTFTGDGSGLSNLNASNVTTGTLADARLSANVTLQGNNFNAAGELVQLNALTQLPAVDASQLTNLNGSAVSSGTVGNAYLVNSGALTVTAGTGLNGGGSVALGGSTTLNVVYGNAASTAAEGNTDLSFSGSGNLTGSVNLTAGGGVSSNTLAIVNSPTFSGTLAVQGAGGLTIGAVGTTDGLLNLISGSHTVSIGSAAQANDLALSIPADGHATDTFCLETLGNCSGASGAAGGDLSGTYPNPTVVGIQNNPVIFTSLTAGDVLQYDGTDIVNGKITNTNFAANTMLGNVTGVGALTSGSIASGFGTISTASDISTTTTLQGGTVNATGTLELGGQDINTPGTLTNVAYLTASAQTFTGANTFDASGTALTVTNDASIGGTGTLGTLAVVGDATVGGNLTVTGTSTLTGAVTGGTYNGQTISSAASLTGSLSVASDTTIGGLLTVTGQLSANGGLTTNNAAITTGSGTINGATITGGSLDSSSVNGLGLTSTAITGTGALSISAGGTNQDLSLQGSGTGGVIIQTPTFYNANGATYSFDASDASSITATICTSVGNCTTAGAAGGDLTGTYPNPQIAKLQGTPFLLSTLASGQVLQYDGTNWINGLLTNSNLQAGSFANITGTGALTSGSIGSGFGTIATASDITTTALLQGNIVNATGAGAALELNGQDINTGGTLGNVAYLDQANTFTQSQTISAAGGKTTLQLTSTGSNTGITFGGDTNLYRTSAGTLKTDGTLAVGNAVTATGNVAAQYNLSGQVKLGAYGPSSQAGIVFGSASDTNLYRSAAGVLQTDGSLNVGTNLSVTGTSTLTGAVTGGTYNGQTIGSAASFTGTLSVATSVSTPLLNVTSGSFNVGISSATQTGNVALTVPVVPSGSDEICLKTLGNCSATGSSFIVNGTGLQTNANFNIQSNAVGNVTATIEALSGQTADLMDFKNSSGTGVTVINSSGDIKTASRLAVGVPVTTSLTGMASLLAAGSSTNVGVVVRGAASQSADLLQLQNSSGAVLSHFDASGNLAIGSASAPGYPLDVTGNINTSTGYLIAGQNINTGGTLTNVAYLDQANSFSQSQTITAAGATALQLTASNSGITFGGDTSLYRSAAGTLQTGGKLVLGSCPSGNAKFCVSGGGAQTTGLFNNAGTGDTLDLQNNGTNVFTVSNTGATTLSSTLAVTGTSTLTGQLNANGGIITNNTNINAGTGTITSGAVNGQTISSTANFTGTLSVATSVSTPLLNITSGSYNVGISSDTQGNDVTLTIPVVASGSDEICLKTLGNCSGASGAAGGDLSGTYPNPQIAKLQGTPFLLSTLASGQVLQYDGTNWINDLITNANLQAGTFANITGTGALTAGSIGGSFGTISTTSDITTTATIQGAVVNATGTLELGGADINTGGVLGNVAYLDQANSFSQSQTISAAGATALQLTASNGGITLGGDTDLYRSVASTLTTDSKFLSVRSATNPALATRVTGNTSDTFQVLANGVLQWGSGTAAADTNLYRSAANTLKTDDSLIVGTNLSVTGTSTLTGQLAANGGIVTNNTNINAGTGTITSGAVNGQTISSAANFTGTLSVAGNTTVGGNLTVTGTSTFHNANGATYTFDASDASAVNATICTTVGNCAGSGGGITGSGATGQLAVFNGSGSITSYSGLTYASGNLTASGAVQAGSLALASGGNTLTLQAGSLGGNLIMTLPTSYGSNGDCLETDGLGTLSFQSCTGGAGGGVTSLDGLAGVLTINNSSGSGSAITINNASTSQKGIAQFNATNFQASSGVINTIQDIATSSSPSFNGLTVGSSASVATSSGSLYVGSNSSNQAISLHGGSGNQAIEIGRTDGTASTPYIDFHSGATADDFDARIVASGGTGVNGQGTLTLSAATSAVSGALTVTGTTTLTGQLNANGGIVTNNTNINAGTGTITSGAVNGQTISSAANFTGTLAVATSVSTPLLNVTSGSYNVGISSATQANNVALSIPVDANLTDTICLQTLGNCNATGSNFIVNGTGLQTNANFNIQSNAVGNVTATIKALSGQTADLQEWQDSSGNVLAYINSNGGFRTNGSASVQVGGVISTTQLGVVTSGPGVIGAAIKGASGQTADLLQLQNNAGTVLSHFAANGNLAIGSASAPGYPLDVTGNINTSTGYLIGGQNINSAGTLNNVAYLNQANTFTNSTNTFSGSGTALSVTNNASIGGNLTLSGSVSKLVVSSESGGTNDILESKVSGDTNNRFIIGANGRLQWGSGSAAVDTNLYRNAPNTLQTDDSLVVGTNLSVTGTSTLTGQLNANGGIVTNNTNINAGTGTITSGAVNGQTISSSANFTGTLAVATSVSTPLLNITSGSYNIGISSATQTGNVALTIPAVPSGSDTICLQTLGNCNATGSSFIVNGTGLQTNANFNIQSASTSSVTATIDGLSGQTADLLDVKLNADTGIRVAVNSSGKLVIGNGFGSTSTLSYGNLGIVDSGRLSVGNVDLTGNAVLGVSSGTANVVAQIIRGASGQTADLLQLQNSGGTVLSHFAANGNLAIGSASAPGYPLDVTGNINTSTGYLIGGQNINSAGTLNNVAYLNQANTFTQAQTVHSTSTATSGTVVGTTLQETASPPSASSAFYYGSQSTAIYNGTASNTGALTGGYNLAQQNAGSGVNASTLYGSYGVAQLNSAGSVGTAIGALGTTNTSASSTGTITAAIGVRAVVANGSTAGASITNAYGLQVQSPGASATGTIGTAYGVYIQAQATTGVGTAYGLYQAGSSDLNVLKGATTLNNTLSVTGAASFTAAGTGLSVTNNATIGGTLGVTGATSLSGTLTVGGITTLNAMGTADTNTALCLNSTNQIASCAGSGSGAAFVQGGNSFGATGVLGTNDNFGLNIRTNGNTALALDTSGNGTLTGNLTVSGTGTSSIGGKLTVATALGVGTAPNATEALRVQLASGTGATIGGTCSNNGTVALYLCDVDASQITLAARAISGQTGNLFDLQDSSGSNLVAVTAGGQLTVSPTARTDTSGSIAGSTFKLTASPSSASTAAFYASASQTTYNGTASDTSPVYGAINQATQAAGSSVNLSYLYGSFSQSLLSGAGTVTNGVGVYGQANVLAAATGTVANAFGAKLQVVNNSTAGGSITTAYGLQVQTPTASATGTIGTDYGVYIQAQATTGVGTAYGLYQQGGTDLNVLNGATTINNQLKVINTSGVPIVAQTGTGSIGYTAGPGTAAIFASAPTNSGSYTNINISGGATGRESIFFGSYSTAALGQLYYDNTTSDFVLQNGGHSLTYDANGNLGIGVTPTAGAGLLQLASGTTAANGIAFGTDTNLYRSAANTLKTDDGLIVGTLGSGGTTALCADGSGQISTCSGTGTGAAFVQGGNSFGATAILGTKDNYALALETNNATKAILDTSGNLTFQQASIIQTNTGNLTLQAAGTSTLILDTAGAGGKISVGTNATTITLGTGSSNETVYVGNSTGTDTVNIATNGGNDQVFVGSSASGTAITLQGGASKLVINNTASAFTGNVTSTGNISASGNLTAGNTVSAVDYNSFLATTNSNTYYTGNINSIAQSPMGNEWHDLFAFNRALGAPTFETYDGTSWNSAALNSQVFAQTENVNVGIINGTSTTAARYTWNSGSLAYSQSGGTTSSWLVLKIPYIGTPVPNINVLVESSADGTTWTTRTSVSGMGQQSQPVYIPVSSWGNDTHLRITITDNNGQTVSLTGLQMLTSRVGNQGFGSELQYPYTWDSNMDIQLIGTGSATGVLQVGSNTTTSQGGIFFGNDTDLYRGGANLLQTDDSLAVGTNLSVSGSSTLTGNVGIGSGPGVNSKLIVSSAVTDPTAGQLGINASLISTQTSANSNYLHGIQGTVTVNGSGGNTGIVAASYNEAFYNNSGTGANINGGEFFVIQQSSGGGITSANSIYSRVDNNSANAIGTAYGLHVANNTGTGSITNNIGLKVEALSGTSTAYGIQVAAPTGATTKAAINLSDTGGTSAGGLLFGTDTNLYRSAANTLQTDDSFIAGNSAFQVSASNAGVGIGSAPLSGVKLYVYSSGVTARINQVGTSDLLELQNNGTNVLTVSSSGATSLSSTLSVGGITTLNALGTADTNNALCLNSSNQITSCAGSGSGAAFVQGGNSFGATAILGTKDNYALALETNNVSKAILDASGNLTFLQASTIGTSTGNLHLQAAGTSTLFLDTAGAGTVLVGTNANNIYLGSGSGTESVYVGASSGNDTVQIAGVSGGSDTVNIGTSGNSVNTNIYGNPYVGGGVNATGYKTTSTGGTYSGQWTLLGTCTLVAQYQDCHSEVAMVNSNDGLASNYHTTLDYRVKQQNALGGAPIVNVTLDNTQSLTASQFMAVTTQNDGSATVVALYMLVNTSNQDFFFNPLVNAGAKQVAWVSNQSYSTTLPAGTQTAASYSTNINGGLLIQPATDAANVLQVENAAASSTLFSVDTLDNVVGVGAVPSASGATLQVAGSLSAGSAAQFGVDTSGNVTTSGTLTVNNSSSATSGTITGSTLNLTANPSSASSAIFYGSYSQVTYTGTASSTGNIIGADNVGNASAGSGVNVANVYGTYGQALHNGSGTVGSMTAVAGQVVNNPSASGTVSNATGVRISIANNSTSGGSITNAYGLQVSTPTASATGTIGTAYGVYINPQAGTGITNAYGIYQAGSSDTNVLNASTTIFGGQAKISLASGTSTALSTQVNGDTNGELSILANGKLQWGSGSAAADVALYRSGTGTLAVSGSLTAAQSITSSANVAAQYNGTSQVKIGNYGPSSQAGIVFGQSADANLYRVSAGLLQTDGSLNVGTNLAVTGTSTLTGNVGIGATSSANAGLQVIEAPTDPSTAQYGVYSSLSSTQTAANANAIQAVRGNVSINGSGGTTGLVAGLYGQATYNNTGTGTNIQGAEIVAAQGSSGGGVTAMRGIYTRVDNNSTNAIVTSYGMEIANNIGTGSINANVGLKVDALSGVNSAYGIQVAAPTSGTTKAAINLSDTGGTSAGGLLFGTDTNLYRSAANTLKTDDGLVVGTLGSGGTTALCANGSNQISSCASSVGVNGSGTVNTIAMFTGSNTIGNSILSQSGTTLSVAGALTATGTINGATISGGTLSGGSLSATAVNGLSVSGGVITNPQIAGTVTGSGTPNITGFGTYNGQTIGSASSFSGTVAIQGANALTLGNTGSATGAILFQGATAASGTITLQGPANPGTYTLTLPNESGTLCSTGSVCAGYAPSTGGNYIAKGTPDSSTAAVTATNNLLLLTNSNSGVASGVLSLVNAGTNSALTITQSSNPTSGQALILANNTNATPTGNLIDLQNKGVSEFNVDKSGNSTQLGLATTLGLNAQNGLIQGSAGLTVTGGSVNLNVNSNNATNINTGSSTGAISVGNSTAGAISLQSGSSIGLTGATSVSLQTNTSGAINIGTSAQNTITIGNSTANTQVNIQGGVGLGSAGDINIGNNAVTSSTRYINIGSTGSTAGSNVVNIATSNNTSYAQTVNIGTNTTGNSSVLIQGGTTGSVALQTGTGGTINLGTTAGSTIKIGNTTNGGSVTLATSGANPVYINPGGGSNTGVLVKPGANSTKAFQVQDTSGNSVFNVNTSTSPYANVGIGSSAATGAELDLTYGSNNWDLGVSSWASGFYVENGSGGSPVLNIQSNGNAIFQNSTDSTTAFQVQNAGGTSILNVDTNAGRVGIGSGLTAPAYTLDVLGASSGYVGQFDIAGTDSASNSALLTFNSNRGVVGYDGINQAAMLQSGTGKGIELMVNGGPGVGTSALSIDSTGSATFKPVSNSTASFQIQNTAGTSLLTMDTVDGTIGIGANGAPTSQTVYIWAGSTKEGLMVDQDSTSTSSLLRLQHNGSDVATFTSTGQLQLATQGITGGLTIGGDTSLYRYNTDMLATGAGDSLRTFANDGSHFMTLQSTATAVYLESRNNAASDWVLDSALLTDTQPRFTLKADGSMFWGSGSASPNIIMNRSSAGDLVITDASSNYLLDINPSSKAIVLDGGVTGGSLTADIAGSTTTHGVCKSGTGSENVQFVACSGAAGADYTEQYPVASGVSYGDVVATGTQVVDTYNANADGTADWNSPKGQITQLIKSTGAYQANTIGVVSDNNDQFSSTGYNIKSSDNPVPVALDGRVLINMAPDSPAIAAGDYVTTSGTYPGKAMKATAAGFTIGKALAAWDPASGQTQVMVFVEPGYWPGPTATDTIQNGGDATLSSLNVTGMANFADLNVSGTATINNLTVTTLNAASATIGTLTVTGSAQFAGDITIGGHVITAGGQPTAQSGGSIGTGASVAVDGTDTTGTITITTGANPSAGDLAKILFSKTYGAAPHIVLSPSNDKAAGLHFYKGATTSTDFMFDTTDTPAANTTYTFDYFIAQ